MRSNDESHSDYARVMGETEAKRFTIIRNQWAELWCLWDDYQELFLSSQDRLDILSKSARLFFHSYRKLAQNALLLGVARLMDTNPRTCSLHTFVTNFVSQDSALSPTELTEFKNLLADAVQKSAFTRGWRDQLIAHRDLDTSGVLPFNFTEIKTAIDAVHALLAAVEQKYLQCHLVNDVISPPEGALSLLYCLRDGIESEDRRQELLRSGQLSWEELAPRPLERSEPAN